MRKRKKGIPQIVHLISKFNWLDDVRGGVGDIGIGIGGGGGGGGGGYDVVGMDYVDQTTERQGVLRDTRNWTSIEDSNL